jgi:NAD-dependent SIR2 family protein deacetylase
VPQAGFGVLNKWANAKNGSWVFTSNVDGQFQKAGFSLDRIHECHGSIQHLQCMDECTSDIWSADEFMPQVDEVNCLLLNEPLRCPRCGAMARPNVLMFGDWSWSPRRTALQSQREDEWLESIGDHQRVVVVELGAGTAIPSVRNFSQRIINELGGRLVRINPREFQVPGSVDVGIPLGSLEAFVCIDAALGNLPVEMDLDFTGDKLKGL